MRKPLLSFIFSCIAAATCLAQKNDFVFTRLTKQNGLASSGVNRILQDHEGFYWLSSFNGVQRYDGRRMVTFQHDPSDSLSLPDNQSGIMMEDNKKRLWFNSGGKVCLYDPSHRNFKRIPVDSRDKDYLPGHTFFQDNTGLIWLAAQNDGIFVLDTINNIFKPYDFVWPKCAASIFNIAQDNVNGNYWVSTSKGVFVYDPRKKEYYHNGYNPMGWKCFEDSAFSSPSSYDPYIDKNGIAWFQIWVEKKGYLHFRYDIKKDELTEIKLVGNHFWGCYTDASGITWAYGDILGWYDEKTKTFIKLSPKRNSQYGIDFNEVYYMYEDKEDNLWLLTNLGSYSFNPRHQYFTTYGSVWSNSFRQLTDGNTNGFIETNDGHILSLSWGGDGVYFFDTSFNQVSSLYGYSHKLVKYSNQLLTWCGIQDSHDVIWVGCQSGFITKIDPATRQVTSLHPPEFENRTIRSIAEDKNGNLWFGTQNNIIVKWTRSANTYKQVVPLSREKYSLGWTLRMLRGNDNDLWAGTVTGGLLHIDCSSDSIVEQFLPDKKNPASIQEGYVREIIRWNKDTLVVIAGLGIDFFSLKTKTFTHITQKDGLPPEGMFSMVKDDNNNLWFSTVDGISKIHLPDKRIHNYGPIDGITERDFQLRSVACLKNNKIVFGNTRGFVVFKPDAINEIGVPADVLITGFTIFNNGLSVDSIFQSGKTIRLGYSENYITIQFASLSHILTNRPYYYYKLEGIDKDWIKAGDNQEAIYTYLPDGNYTFKVKCISPDGIESKNITSFTIHISPPFWKTWWFVSLLLAIVIAISWYIYLLRMRRRNEREIIRNRIARDLHDDMGSTLSTINILSSMAKSKLHTDEIKTSEYINKIGDNSQRMMEAMDDIVWAIKPDNDSMQRIIARMREFSTNVLEAKEIELNFKVDEKVNDLKLDMEARRDLFLIFKEAVNNVAKYSHCDKCSIYIGVRQHRLVLDIQDNGTGFDVNNADSGNGLSNMQKRAASLKGRIQIQSKKGEGTTVTLNIPVK